MNTVGERIRALRESIPLKSIQFAPRVDIKPNYLSQLENGHKDPSIHLLKRICLEFGANKHWLTFGKGPMLAEPDPAPSQPSTRDSDGGGTILKPNLEKALMAYPQLKYAIMFAEDKNKAELNRVILKWAEQIKSEEANRRAG